jgi:uncharacterized protein (DUF1800 family)
MTRSEFIGSNRLRSLSGTPTDRSAIEASQLPLNQGTPNPGVPNGGMGSAERKHRDRALASTTGLELYTGAWGVDQAAHLLRRTMFGARVEDITTVLKGTMSQAVDMLLTPAATPDPPLIYFNNGHSAQGTTWVSLPYDATVDDQYLASLTGWWINLMQTQNISIAEKMTLFWHNHFATGSATVKSSQYMYQQNALLRQNALGNFKALAKQITFNPATLRYLSGNQNTKVSPNENYGRELQELFTIGKGPEISTGNYTTYTEADVKAAAHVLTGWSDDVVNLKAVFNPANHDSGNKQFSSAYGNTVIKGGADQAGATREIDDLLTMIFNQRATALYISRKIYRWFIDYVIDANIEKNVIGPMADLMMQNNYDVKPVLAALFKSAHFYDVDHVGSMIKNPIDFTIGTLRLFDVAYANMIDLLRHYYAWIGVQRTTASMAMTLCLPPNVAGWAAYYQDPVYYELWVNSDTLQKRIKFVDDLAIDGYTLPENQVKTYIDVLAFAKLTSDPSKADTLIAEWCKFLFPIVIDPDQVTTLHDSLLNGLPNYEWGVEWNDYINNPTDATKQKTVEDKLRTLLKYMLEMAEYQLM